MIHQKGFSRLCAQGGGESGFIMDRFKGLFFVVWLTLASTAAITTAAA